MRFSVILRNLTGARKQEVYNKIAKQNVIQKQNTDLTFYYLKKYPINECSFECVSTIDGIS